MPLFMDVRRAIDAVRAAMAGWGTRRYAVGMSSPGTIMDF